MLIREKDSEETHNVKVSGDYLEVGCKTFEMSEAIKLANFILANSKKPRAKKKPLSKKRGK